MNHLPENPEEADAQPPESGFLQRWSQRKSADAEPATVPYADADTAPTDNDGAVAEHARGSQDEPGEIVDEAAVPILTDEDMEPIDALDADSDYTPFMSEGVSSELRQRALKKLFFSGLFKARDGLDDYDDDFTSFEPLGDTITSDMKYHMRREEKARLAKQEAELEEERLRQAQGEPAEAVESDADAASFDEPTGDSEVASDDAEDNGDGVSRPTDDQQATDDAVVATRSADQTSGDSQTTEQTGKSA